MRYSLRVLMAGASLLTLLVLSAPAQADPSVTLSADAATTADATHFQIEDLAWLSGSWVGEHFGDKAVEVISPIEGDSMVGYYRTFNLETQTLTFLETDLIQENADGVFWYFHIQGPAGAVVNSPFDSFSAYKLVEVGDHSATFEPDGGDGSVIRQRMWVEGNTLHGALTLLKDGKPVEITLSAERSDGTL